MTHNYDEARECINNPIVYIRLKQGRKYYRCEYYDGMRILFDTIPVGKHRYETRHPDGDVNYPVSIKPEGKSVIVNFCGTIVSDIPIAIDEEKKIMDIWYWDYSTDDQFKNRIY